MRLSRSDLEGALGFVAEAGEVDGTEPFPPALLSSFAALLRCAEVSYFEVDRARRRTTAVASFETAAANVPAKEEEDLYWATVHEHPIRNHRASTGDLAAYKIYDFTSPRQLRQTQFYADYVRHVIPGGFLMSFCLPAPARSSRTFTLVREHADFGERERVLLNLLQPHLVRQYRSTEVRGHALATLSGVNGLLTQRETEVLRHVAEGMRNREIAQALWIAPGTVRKHLDNIYAKLEVRTRTAAAALVFPRGVTARDEAADRRADARRPSAHDETGA